MDEYENDAQAMRDDDMQDELEIEFNSKADYQHELWAGHPGGWFDDGEDDDFDGPLDSDEEMYQNPVMDEYPF